MACEGKWHQKPLEEEWLFARVRGRIRHTETLQVCDIGRYELKTEDADSIEENREMKRLNEETSAQKIVPVAFHCGKIKLDRWRLGCGNWSTNRPAS